jgi:hypothetical protein
MKSINLIIKVVSILTLAMLGTALISSAVWAHEQRNVHNYSLEVGFFTEPAIEGQMNGLDLRVTNSATQQPVTGLEKTLKVEISCVPAKASRTFDIEPVDPDGDPGHYNNGFIPTTPGQYSFRIFGTIEGTAVNETFSSGPDAFSDVGTAAGVQFPQTLPSLREVSGVVQADQQNTQTALNTATSARTLAISLSVVAIVIAGASVVIALKKR